MHFINVSVNSSTLHLTAQRCTHVNHQYIVCNIVIRSKPGLCQLGVTQKLTTLHEKMVEKIREA